jgi:hypothetical protein
MTLCIITGRLINTADGSESIRLTWPRDGQWKHHPVNRAVIASCRSITELANVGLPVTSRSAGNLVSYLADFEAINLAALPRARASAQMGWQGEKGDLGFLWGRVLIRPDLSIRKNLIFDISDKYFST